MIVMIIDIADMHGIWRLIMECLLDDGKLTKRRARSALLMR